MIDIERILLASAARVAGPRAREGDRARIALTMAVGMLEGLLDEDHVIRELARQLYIVRLSSDQDFLAIGSD